MLHGCRAALRGAQRRGWLPNAVAGAELLRLIASLGYGLAMYFGRARPPPPELLRAARVTTAMRAGGLVLAGTRRRRAGVAVLATGSVTSFALVIAAGRVSPSRSPFTNRS